MRIGVLGGSFDPIHFGHLWIGEAALESLELDQVRWMPAAQSPLKPQGPIASEEARLQMLRLAVAGSDQHVVDDKEIRRGAVSYTIDTMTELRTEFPQAEFWLIIGSDSLQSFRQWREPERLLQMAQLAVVQRGGEPEIDFSALAGLAEPSRIDLFRQSVIKMPVIEISSTEMRARVREGRSIRFRVPRPVEAMIQAQGLYRV
jgi:nicotinate-nucleotide adenylyltransferase